MELYVLLSWYSVVAMTISIIVPWVLIVLEALYVFITREPKHIYSMYGRNGFFDKAFPTLNDSDIIGLILVVSSVVSLLFAMLLVEECISVLVSPMWLSVPLIPVALRVLYRKFKEHEKRFLDKIKCLEKEIEILNNEINK